MNRIEQELFDLEEHLRRNDDIADNSAYLTIIGIANKVSELDAENAKLREQSARLFDKTLELGTENEKLRELVRKWYPHMLKRVGRDALKQWGQMDVVKELGIEVIDG